MIPTDKIAGRFTRPLGRHKRDQGIVRRRELLAVLAREGRPMTVRELARAADMSASVLYGSHLPRLETAGAIVRENGMVRLP